MPQRRCPSRRPNLRAAVASVWSTICARAWLHAKASASAARSSRVAPSLRIAPLRKQGCLPFACLVQMTLLDVSEAADLLGNRGDFGPERVVARVEPGQQFIADRAV